jgi:hypothetical protein
MASSVQYEIVRRASGLCRCVCATVQGACEAGRAVRGGTESRAHMMARRADFLFGNCVTKIPSRSWTRTSVQGRGSADLGACEVWFEDCKGPPVTGPSPWPGLRLAVP